MKKFYYLLASMAFVLILIASCEKAGIESDELNALQDEVLLEKGAKADKVDICHWDNYLGEYYHLNISKNGWDNGHINHDYGEDMTDYLAPLIDNDSDGDGIADCADCNTDGAEGSKKTTYYYDFDGDEYGTDDYIETCEPRPEMFYTATMSGDCNDAVFAINPGATEVCDGVDNNCDGNIDEGLTTSLEGTFVFHYKLDGENYPHTFVFTNFDGTSFEGMGYWPAEAPYTYEYPMEGTVDGDGNFEVHTIDSHPTWTITGTYNECDGFVFDSPWSTTEWVF